MSSIIVNPYNAQFSPNIIKDCIIWYDFSRESGSEDDEITEVRNLIGSADHDLTAASGKRPLLKDAVNPASAAGMAQRSLLFDGSDDHFTCDNEFVSGAAVTIAVSFRLTGDVTDGTADALISGDNAGLDKIHIYNQNTIQLRFNAGGTGDAGNNIAINNTDNSTTSYQITTGVEALVIRKDGSDNFHLYAANAGNTTASKIGYLAASANTDKGFGFGTLGIQLAGSLPLTGYMGEFSLHNADVGDGNSKIICQYLYDKWN